MFTFLQDLVVDGNFPQNTDNSLEQQIVIKCMTLTGRS